MAPFLVRSSDKVDQISPYTLYFILCEGAKTEYFYFEGLLSQMTSIDEKTVPKTIKLIPNARFIDKVGKDRNNSAPKNLIKVALDTDFRKEQGIRETDKFVIVFDLDIFAPHRLGSQLPENSYEYLLDLASDGVGTSNIFFAVTNPCFELFLLLHHQDAYKKIIQPDMNNIFQNDEVSTSHRYITRLFSTVYGFNSKSNKKIQGIAENFGTAIEEEKNLNQELGDGHQKITSNVGKIIKMMIDEARSQRIY